MQTYYDFTEFLATLPADMVLLLAIISLLLFTLGLLLGWLLQKRSTRSYRKQVVIANRDKDEYQTRLTAADDEQKSLARELVQLTTEKDELLVQLRNNRATQDTLTNQLSAQRAINEQLLATNQSFATTIEDLNDQVIGLKTRNAQLLSDPAAPAGSGDATLEQRLRAIENSLSKLQEAPAPVAKESPALNLGRSTHQVTIGDPLAPTGGAPPSPDGNRDDLMKISSIGPFNREKLYEAGITNFSQIAAWTDADIDDYAARIGYVAELIRIQDWVGQAGKLAGSGAPQRPARETLTRLDGIDDELAVVLQDGGIRDLADLAATPPTEVEAILFQSGRQPVSGADGWPEQARRWLAQHGDVSPVG